MERRSLSYAELFVHVILIPIATAIFANWVFVQGPVPESTQASPEKAMVVDFCNQYLEERHAHQVSPN